MKQAQSRSFSHAAITFLFSLTALAASSAFAQNIAVVNSKPIPKAKADEMVAQAVKQGQANTPELQNAVREQLITREILLQEAAKQGYGSNADIQQQIELARQQVLIGALANDYFKNNPPTDAEVRGQYDALVKEMGNKEYHVRHILVETEPAAKAIITKLKAGAKFEDLAKGTKDTGSAEKGGDLDWAQPSMFVKEFSDAMVKLPKGKFTEVPVKSQFGYHIIRVDDIRDMKAPSFEEAKPQIVQAIMQNQQWQQMKFQALIQDLRGKAKIE